MFWLSVEVFKNRNWKAAKFFGMDADPLPVPKAPTITPPPSSTPSKKAELERRKSRKEKQESAIVNAALTRQRQLDQSAATRLGVSLQQLYLVKEADFIFDNFIKRDGVYWTCLDADSVKDIEEQLMEPTKVRRDLYEKAQSQAFNGMNDDLMPRFLKEIIQASMLDPVPEAMRQVVNRFDELRKEPVRRKTGVSTALAFMFRRTSTEKDSKLQTVSSREQGLLNKQSATTSGATRKSGVPTQPEKPIDANKASTLLRQKSALAFLGSEAGSVSALALSRSRLSYGNSESPLLGQSGKKSNLSGKSALGGKARDMRKRISAPLTDPETKRDSFPRRFEMGLQRSQSDSKLLSRSTRLRAREMGLDNPGTQNPRATASKTTLVANPDGGAPEEITLVLEQAGQRKNSA